MNNDNQQLFKYLKENKDNIMMFCSNFLKSEQLVDLKIAIEIEDRRRAEGLLTKHG